MEPINYMQNLQPVDILGSLQSGLKFGQDIKAQQDQQAQAEQYKVDLKNTIADPSPQNIAALQLSHPDHAKVFGEALNSLPNPKKNEELKTAGAVYFALNNGDTETVNKILQEKITATDNSGGDSTQLKQIAEMAKKDPKMAATIAGSILYQGYGAEGFNKFITTNLSAQKAPLEEEKIASDIETQKWDNKIKILTAQRAKNLDVRQQKELDLKIQEAQDKKDELQNKKTQLAKKEVAEGQTSLDFTRSAKGVLNDILSDPESLAAVTGASAFKGLVPGTTNRAMNGKIDQLRSMLAAANKDVLKGPTSDKDIVFLKSIAANLDQYQDEDEFKKVLGKIKVILDKNEKIITNRYGVKASTYMENAPKQEQQQTRSKADNIVGNR